MTRKELQIAIAVIPWNVIAATVGVTRDAVQKWRAGERFPSGEKLLKLMELLEREKKKQA